MGFSWNDWHLLRLVSDSGISTFHQGHRGIDSALVALERVSNEKLPAGACKDVLRRVFKYLKKEGLSS